MPLPETYRVFSRRFEELGVPYMITGSVAAIYYGEPRLTNDVDLVVHLRREDAERMVAAFPLEEFYCPPVEVIEMEAAREQRGHFNLIHHESGFKADVYLVGSDPLHLWALENVEDTKVDDDRIFFAPPEYVIIRKLQFYREGNSEKHLRDIERMLTSFGDSWARKKLEELVAAYGLDAEWQKIGV